MDDGVQQEAFPRAPDLAEVHEKLGLGPGRLQTAGTTDQLETGHQTALDEVVGGLARAFVYHDASREPAYHQEVVGHYGGTSEYARKNFAIAERCFLI